MKRQIRIAVAGLGRIGWDFHCRQIAKHSRDFVLAAVADPEPARRAEAEKEFGCRAYADYREMLRAGGLDAMVVATPTHLHRAMAAAALRGGRHVILEKPMALTAADARAIADCAARRRRVLTVYQTHRLIAYFQQLRHLIADGRIGRVYHVRHGVFWFVRRDDWQSLRKYGGGMLNNYGAHDLDQALNLTGNRVKRLFCQLRRVATLGDADDAVKIVYETFDGVIGEVDINMGAAVRPYEFEVQGTTGGIRYQSNEFTVRWFDPRKLKPKKLHPGLASLGRSYPQETDVPWREEKIPVDPRFEVDLYADFARAIRTGKPPFVPPAESVRVMEVMERCRRDAGPIVESRWWKTRRGSC